MKIKEFSQKCGLSIDTLRYYEKENLLQPSRDINGYRIYGDRDIEWVGFILRLKEMGVPISQIKVYAQLRYLGDSTIHQRYELLLQHQKRLQLQQQKLSEHQAYLEDKLKFYREIMD
ncbi:MerR family transcriptional regulator [Rodentibacter genomosp. 2]|uniref:MerR family transcriptional regulator n=1 Tax=Rodentibacter genomosp. 2 TaxID=1908266 RepID=A0A1V3JPT8_9PAST|nr:MerR family transcriptional regulator [Rodentibacter genomosp. 2]OOF58805.1 MerR family transcriptional regulator [Rodentibacter genomosp. 2]